MKNGINLKGEVKYELFRKDGSVEVEIVKNTISSDFKEIIAKALTTNSGVDMAFDDLFDENDDGELVSTHNGDGIALREDDDDHYFAVDMTDQPGISIGVSYSSNVFTAVGYTNVEGIYNQGVLGVDLAGTPEVITGSPICATQTISDKTVGAGDSLKITWTITVS